MPFARSGVLWAHVFTSMAADLISLVIVMGVAALMRFRSGAGIPAWLAISGILLLFTLGLTWIAVILILTAASVEGAGAFAYPLIFLRPGAGCRCASVSGPGAGAVPPWNSGGGHGPGAREGAGRTKEAGMRLPVLVGVDGSERAAAAADRAAREAVLRGVPLRLLHASPSLPGAVVPGPALDRLRDIGAQLLQRTVADLAGRYPDLRVESVQADDAPAVALAAAARDAGLLVAGMRGTGGFEGLAVGSVALRVAATAPCPVVLVPHRPGAFAEGGPAAHSTGPVVLGFDAHRPAGEVADFAFSAADAHAARLHVVQAWALPAESVSSRILVVTEEDRASWEDQEVLRLADVLRPWQEKYPGVTVAGDLMLLHPAEALLNASRSADLLVVGRRAEPRGAEGRLGPVAHAVLHHARCPVAVVPHEG